MFKILKFLQCKNNLYSKTVYSILCELYLNKAVINKKKINVKQRILLLTLIQGNPD